MASFLLMSLSVILKWFAFRYPIFIFLLFQWKFFRIIWSCLNFESFSISGDSIDIL